ncbi:MAG: CHAT domain-containing protein [Leptolyngbyaceae cyanobacterium]
MGRLQIFWHRRLCLIGSVGLLSSILWAPDLSSHAQILSAEDSVQTRVVQQDDKFTVLGGTTTDGGTLLFHSFEQFDLERGDSAEFQVAPGVDAVFSRIVNGIPSNIDGSIALSGGVADVYLINPAGVLFGTNASIDLAGDFTVVTAERLDFDQGYFGLSGHPDSVRGNILRFEFNPDSVGTIINSGNLKVDDDRSLSLLGHSVTNQGTSSGGRVTLAAVGTHERIVLDNGFRFLPDAQTSTTLPPWLSAPGAEHATAIELGQDGSLSLTGSPLSDIAVGTALVGGELTATESIQILGDHVATMGSTLRAVDGGQILIGGDYQGRGVLPTAQSTLIDAASTIIADGEMGGQVVIWADDTTQFRGAVSAQGNQAGGLVEVSGKRQLYFGGVVDLRSQGTPGTLLLDPENIEIRAGSDPGEIGIGDTQTLYEDTLESSIIGDANVVLQADNNITIAPLSDGELRFAQGSGSVSFLADADGDGQGSFTMAPSNRLSAPGRDVLITAADITLGDIATSTFSTIDNSIRAGDIYLSATPGNIVVNTLNTATRSVLNNRGNGGSVSLSATDGDIVTGDIVTAAAAEVTNSGDAGDISLTTLTGSITAASLMANTEAGSSNRANGGLITLNAPGGSIVAQRLDSTTISSGAVKTQGGDIGLNAADGIVVDSIDASGEGQGGNIDVSTQQSFRAVDTVVGTDASLLTTGGSTIRLTYSSEPAVPFVLGDSAVHGTAGTITSGVDTLNPPQTTTQTIQLDTIELNNLFEPPAASSPSTLELSPSDPLPISLERFNPSETVLADYQLTTATATRGEQDKALDESELLWTQIEMAFSAEFAQALNLPIPASPSLQTTQQTLKQVSKVQNITPALLYVQVKDTHLDLVLITDEGPPIHKSIAVTTAEMQSVVETFHQTVTNPILRPAQYLPAAQQLYDWLVRPLLKDLTKANVDHIGFVVDKGLRSLPMAALHDGTRFLIEDYSIGLLPSVGLTSMESELVAAAAPFEVSATLAMGIADFENQIDLAAVPLELELASQGKDDELYLDHDATLDGLNQHLEQEKFTHVHLATHAVFKPGDLESSYIQLWDQRITLNQLRELPLETIEFLILSACATALGDHAAEFGFAGLAVNVGVQTALASLWSISDEGTLGLMAEFYRALEQPVTRSAALRQAQLAMLRGQVSVNDGTVYGAEMRTIGRLPGLDVSGSWNFSHPAYWSGFTMIGNPW